MYETEKHLDISVLIPTYNRAEILRETLEAMFQVERDGLAVEFVVIDNNSTDHTKEVVESFAERLPIRYLFEPRPGKNCALNKALNKVALGEIVILADDDVSPYENWLLEINDSCSRWPNVCIFGGRNESVWVGGKPRWIKERWGSHLSLGDHDPCRKEEELPPEKGVSGANMWIRRIVFDKGRRFDERFGPRPGKWVAGSETSFQLSLRGDGHKVVYIPTAVVRHRPEVQLRKHWPILRKAWGYGRGAPLKRGIPRVELFQRSQVIWYIHRILSLGYAVCRLPLTCCHICKDRRIGKSIGPTYDIAYNIEAIKLALLNKGKPII